MQIAINRREIVGGLFAGKIKPTSGRLSTNHPGYLDQSKDLAFAPERGEKLLDDAGWIKGTGGLRAKDGKKRSLKINCAGVAEQIGGDGFLIHAFPLTRRYIAEIIDGLVPELQKRGLVRKTYEHERFRDNLLSF